MKELLGITPRPRIVIACAGAGVGLLRTLWETPGASEYLVGAYYPYDGDETSEFLGFRPEQFVSEETSIHLATEAYMRAVLRSKPGENPIGLGLTASVASLKPHRGEHRAHVAHVSDRGCRLTTRTLNKAVGAVARSADDDTVSEIAADIIATDVLRDPPSMPERFRTAFLSRPFFATGPGECRRAEPHDGVFFPGNFDPIHFGHEGIAETVSAWSRKPIIPWITANPPHKSALTIHDMARRAAVIRSRGFPVLFSDGDPLYIDKARRYPGRAFVIGADALVRMLDPKWGPEPTAMLKEFGQLGTKFYVAPRQIESALRTVNDIVPEKFRHLFKGINGNWDVSSTQIRNAIEGA